MEYTENPDRWMLVKVNGTDPHWRIFATWSGGYLHGDSWRLNSGVKSVEDKDDAYYFHGYSGSVYRCHKEMYGTSLYGQSVLTGLVEKSDLLVPLWEEPKNIMEIL
jgi:hypothetical protein